MYELFLILAAYHFQFFIDAIIFAGFCLLQRSYYCIFRVAVGIFLISSVTVASNYRNALMPFSRLVHSALFGPEKIDSEEADQVLGEARLNNRRGFNFKVCPLITFCRDIQGNHKSN